MRNTGGLIRVWVVCFSGHFEGKLCFFGCEDSCMLTEGAAGTKNDVTDRDV